MKPPSERLETEPSAAGAAGQEGDVPAAGQRRWPRLSRSTRLLLAFLLGLLLTIGLGWAFFQPFGDRVAASRLFQKAQECHDDLDFAGALPLIDRAVELLPEEIALYLFRGEVRRDAGDLAGSLADFNKAIELNPHFAGGYTQRSTVYQRQELHRQAIDDLSTALGLRPPWDPEPLNNRAYAHALAAEVIDRKELEAGLADIERAITLTNDEVAGFLDTRGYLRYLLDQHEKALVDLDRALSLAEAEAKKQREDGSLTAWKSQQLDHYLAVMFQHRGLVHQQLGHAEQADQDLKRAKELGYDKAKGVY